MVNEVVSRMVKEFPAETLRLIFSDTSEHFQIERAADELKVSAQFIKKWINENRLPERMIEKVGIVLVQTALGLASLTNQRLAFPTCAPRPSVHLLIS